MVIVSLSGRALGLGGHERCFGFAVVQFAVVVEADYTEIRRDTMNMGYTAVSAET